MKFTKKDLEDIKDLADDCYSDMDYSNHHSDLAKERKEDIISYDYSYVAELLETTYKQGFEDGYLQAKGCPTGEWGEYLIED